MTNPSARESGITRRQLVASASATAALAVSMPGLASASNGSVLRVMLTPEAKITPGQVRGGGSSNIVSIIYDWLFRLEGPDQKFTYSLAESATHSPDYKEWTFKLREKIFFHHGTEMTADDLVFSLLRHQRKEVGSPLAQILAHIEKVEKIDTYRTRVALRRPDPDFLLKLLDKNAAILAHDYDYDKLGDSKPSGTGAFKVVEYVPSQYMRLAKNPSYFVPGLPKSDAIEIRFASDTQTQMRAIEAGETDIVRYVPFDKLDRYQARKDLKVQRSPSAYFTPITMRCDQPPFNDVRVRQAMKLVVDRQQMLENAAMGYGVVADDDYIWSGFSWYSEREPKKRDVAAAKQLLAEAGHPKGITVEITCEANRPPVLETVLLYQQMAKDAGIVVTINAVTTDIYYARYFMKAPVTCESWGHREALDLLASSIKSGATWNLGRYSNPEVDKLIEAADSEGDIERRRALSKQIQSILSREGPAIIAYYHDILAMSRSNVEGFLATQNWINDYRFARRA